MHMMKRGAFDVHPTLIGAQTVLLVTGSAATRGYLLAAWTFMGDTVRLAQSIGLHCNPKTLIPIPSSDEIEHRKRLWWRILWYDQYWAMLLGRPVAASSIGTCPMPDYHDADWNVRRIIDVTQQLTILGRQILTAPLSSVQSIKSMIEAVKMLLDNLPEEIRFSDSWLRDPESAPDDPLDQSSASESQCRMHRCNAH